MSITCRVEHGISRKTAHTNELACLNPLRRATKANREPWSRSEII